MRASLFELSLPQKDLQVIDVLDLFAISHLFYPIGQAVWSGVVAGDNFFSRSRLTCLTLDKL